MEANRYVRQAGLGALLALTIMGTVLFFAVAVVEKFSIPWSIKAVQ